MAIFFFFFFFLGLHGEFDVNQLRIHKVHRHYEAVVSISFMSQFFSNIHLELLIKYIITRLVCSCKYNKITRSRCIKEQNYLLELFSSCEALTGSFHSEVNWWSWKIGRSNRHFWKGHVTFLLTFRVSPWYNLMVDWALRDSYLSTFRVSLKTDTKQSHGQT